MKKHRVAFLCSQVIQYLDPLFHEVADSGDIDLKVFYFSRAGAQAYRDQEFGVELKWDREMLKGYEYEFLPNYSPFTRKHNYFEFMNFGVVRVLSRSKFDAVVIYGYGWFISWLSWLTAIVTGTPILFLGETNVLRREKENPLKRAIKEGLLRIFFSRCKAVFYLGKKNREFYSHLGISDEKLFHWPYAVDNDFFIKNAEKYRPLKAAIKEDKNISAEKKIILFSGKLIPKKCPMDLIKAFESMEHREQSALVFAGDGMLREEMERYVSSRGISDVHFMGFLNQTELAKMYAAADIFAFPSDFEPWGLSLNEAMCYSLPVVVSDQISGAYDLVSEGDNGIMFKAGDVKALRGALDYFLKNETDREQMGQRSLSRIQKWSYAEIIKNMREALNWI